jgi:hypothetical protein
MRSTPLGRPVRGVVCLVVARGRRQRPLNSAPGQPMRQARPLLPPVWGWQSLSPAA